MTKRKLPDSERYRLETINGVPTVVVPPGRPEPTEEERAEARRQHRARVAETDGRGLSFTGEGYGPVIDLFAKPAKKDETR